MISSSVSSRPISARGIPAARASSLFLSLSFLAASASASSFAFLASS
jgi:hypothetical protein